MARAATSSSAVAASSASPARRPSRSSSAAKMPPTPRRGERGGDARRSGEDESGERGGADAVREEGEPAQDDLRPEHAGERCEQHHLEGGALHEGELEGIERMLGVS